MGRVRQFFPSPLSPPKHMNNDRVNSVVRIFYGNDNGQTLAKSKLFADFALFQTLSLLLQVTFEKCQMKVNFPGIKLLGTDPKF